MNYVLISVSVLLASYVIYRLVKSKKTNVEVSLDITVEENEEKPEVLVKEEQKVQAVEETVEQMKERLNSIKSTDSEKPFASLSKPTASEIPSELTTSETEDKVATSEAPKAKKKRPYKKRPSKKEKEIKKED